MPKAYYIQLELPHILLQYVSFELAKESAFKKKNLEKKFTLKNVYLLILFGQTPILRYTASVLQNTITLFYIISI